MAVSILTAMAVVAVETPHLMVRLAAPAAVAVALLMVKMLLALAVVHQRQRVDLATMVEQATPPQMVAALTLVVLAVAVAQTVLALTGVRTQTVQMVAVQKQLS